jgi:FkbM family methyltransferase
LGITKKDVLIKTRKNIKFYLRKKYNDKNPFLDVWIANVYGKIDKNTKTILDIGTNIGLYSLYAYTQTKNAKIISLEPIPENIEIIKKNIKINNIHNIILESKALYTKNGTRSIYVSQKKEKNKKLNGENATLIKNRFASKIKKIKIKTITLKSLIKKYNLKTIDLCKMDCEGVEHKIIQETDPAIFKKIRKIVFEQHEYGKTKKNTITQLKKLGYKIIKRKNIITATRLKKN